MGTTLKTYVLRNWRATVPSLSKKSSAPLTIQLAFVSPGCTRALITTYCLSATSAALAEKSVIVSRSHVCPASVRQSDVRLQISRIGRPPTILLLDSIAER